MHYQLFHNQSAGFMRAYEPGDHLVTGYRGEFPGEAILGQCVLLKPRTDLPLIDVMTGLAERIFRIHNMDDRPDGQTAPSLSVGDVVVIGEVALSVSSVGWVLVNPPLVALIDNVLDEYMP